MGHKRVSCTEPASLILLGIRNIKKKLKCITKMLKFDSIEKDSIISPKQYIIGRSQSTTIQSWSTVELYYICVHRAVGHQAVNLTKYLKYRSKLLSKMDVSLKIKFKLK